MERKGTWQPTRNGGAVFVPERAPEAPKGNSEVAAMIDVLAEHCIDQVAHHNEGVASAQQLSVRDKQMVLVRVADALKNAADDLID